MGDSDRIIVTRAKRGESDLGLVSRRGVVLWPGIVGHMLFGYRPFIHLDPDLERREEGPCGLTQFQEPDSAAIGQNSTNSRL